jgi:hypothetical protein
MTHPDAPRQHGVIGHRQTPYALDDLAHPALDLTKYMEAGLPQYTPAVDFASKVPVWPMYMNGPDPDAPEEIAATGIGDCTFATVGHMIEAWTAYAQAEEVLLDNEDLLTGYEDVGKYVLGDEDTDQGCVIQDVLGYWLKTGIGGHRIAAYGRLTKITFADLNAALKVFGSVYLGVNFPSAAMAQFNNGEPWEPVAGDTIEGGHAVCLQRFTPGLDAMHVVTWGQLQSLNKAWMRDYVEEAWAVITPDWIQSNQNTPSALDKQALDADFKALTGKSGPFGTN